MTAQLMPTRTYGKRPKGRTSQTKPIDHVKNTDVITQQPLGTRSVNLLPRRQAKIKTSSCEMLKGIVRHVDGVGQLQMSQENASQFSVASLSRIKNIVPKSDATRSSSDRVKGSFRKEVPGTGVLPKSFRAMADSSDHDDIDLLR